MLPGKPFLLSFVLKDSTSVDMYIVPAFLYRPLSDNCYKLPDKFTEDFEDFFEGLEQGVLPLGGKAF